MAKNEASENKYFASLKERGYQNLKCTPAELAAKTPEDLLRVLMKEGEELVEAELSKGKIIPLPSKTKSDPKVLENALAAMSKNPYVRARIKILNDLPAERRKQIEDMEKNGKTNNATYEQFAKMVSKLGDQFSS